jgi:hypothetical protein
MCITTYSRTKCVLGSVQHGNSNANKVSSQNYTTVCQKRQRACFITINVPLFKKLWNIVVCCWVFLCVVVCCCVLEGWGGLLVAMLCEQVFRGRGLVGGRAPPPPPATSTSSTSSMLVNSEQKNGNCGKWVVRFLPCRGRNTSREKSY